MKQRIFLIYGKNGFRSARIDKPHINKDQVFVILDVEIPKSLFKAPVIKARVRTETTIKENSLSISNSDIKINAEVSQEGENEEGN